MSAIGTIVAALLALAKASVLLLVFLLAVPVALTLWLLLALGRWNAGRAGRSRPSPGGTVDLVQCPGCGDWVEGACGKPGCAGGGAP